MYALCDVNSMYASCEKVFDPSIRNKPVVVLTNNDGCICAACGIAKKMGVGKKVVPYFQVKDDLAKAGAVIRSSNYELYADLSQRMMETCARFAPHHHIYSIDECFLFYGKGHYQPPEGWFEHGRAIRRAIWTEVRLPIGVGLGTTPTLAKAANHASKRIKGYRGVAVIDSEEARRYILSQMEVADVWGIGRKLSKRLNGMNIYTALDLANTRPEDMKKQFSVLVADTVSELNGQVKISWDDVRIPKQQIFSTRSFGNKVLDKQVLKEAIATHTAIVARKLRKQESLAVSMMIFAHNSPHGYEPYYRRAFVCHFPSPTNDTRLMTSAACSNIDEVFRQGVQFYKCGVGAIELIETTQYQHDLFTTSQDSPALMECIDQINHRYGRDTLRLAAQGIEQKFAMRRRFLSPQYTTRLCDLPKIYC